MMPDPNPKRQKALAAELGPLIATCGAALSEAETRY